LDHRRLVHLAETRLELSAGRDGTLLALYVREDMLSKEVDDRGLIFLR
jgi:hypothetical protein